jgi:hypothetical protein
VNVRVVGVYREAEFSPGKVAADAAILDAALALLASRGARVAALSPAQFMDAERDGPADVVLAMCQSEAALEHLATTQRRGTLVINPAHAIRNCYRDRLGAVLEAAGVAVPPGRLIDTQGFVWSDLDGLALERGVFVKRGDLHAMVADDVRRARSRAEIDAFLSDFARRGVKKAYLQQAVEGRVVKFYGVTETYFSIAPAGFELSSVLRGRLPQAAADAARTLELQVWGGDAVVDRDDIRIIDFNDWPSFQTVRTPAAAAIARRVLALMAGR